MSPVWLPGNNRGLRNKVHKPQLKYQIYRIKYHFMQFFVKGYKTTKASIIEAYVIVVAVGTGQQLAYTQLL